MPDRPTSHSGWRDEFRREAELREWTPMRALLWAAVGFGLGLLFEALDISPLFLFVGLAVLMAAEEAYYTRKRRSRVALHRADAEGTRR